MPNKDLDKIIDWIQNRYFGKYRGIVTDQTDPTSKGRIKVRVPAVTGEVELWALPCFPFTGSGTGFYTIPEPGAGVWVEFEAGDPSYPIWSGGWYADNELPQNEKGTLATPPLKIIRSKEGLMVTLDDKGQEINLSDENGKNMLKIEVLKGKITIKGKTKVVVEAPQIELVENANHPVVFGDELLNYLNQIIALYNSHLHPGELALGVFPVTPAPPASPMPPPTSKLISTKVKSG